MVTGSTRASVRPGIGAFPRGGDAPLRGTGLVARNFDDRLFRPYRAVEGYRMVGSHVPPEMAAELDCLSSESGIRRSDIVRAGLQMVLEWGTMDCVEGYIADLESRCRELDGDPCVSCGGTGIAGITSGPKT